MKNIDKREQIVAEAETWLMTPWRHQAAIKGAGVDCGKLIYEVFVAVGLVKREDIPSYSRQWMLHRDDSKMLEWANKFWHPVDYPNLGDVAVWKFGRCFSHAGIVVSWPLVIHASTHAECVLYVDAENSELAGRDVLFFSAFGG